MGEGLAVVVVEMERPRLIAVVPEFQRWTFVGTWSTLRFTSEAWDNGAISDKKWNPIKRGRYLDGLVLTRKLAGVEIVPSAGGQHDVAGRGAWGEGSDEPRRY
jgi:hypothetical protein